MSTPRVRRLPLRGADLVLVAMQALWKREGVSNNTLMVVQCDGPLDPERIRRALDRFLDVCPWPSARLRRRRPWGQLHWAAGARAALAIPPVRHQRLGSPEALHAELEAELNHAIDPRREAPLRLAILDGASEAAGPQSVLVVTWFHPLMDPRGGQNLLAHLAHVDETDGRAPWGGAPPVFVTEPDPRPLKVRGRLGRSSQRYMRTLVPEAPVSPGTGLTAPGRVRFEQASFVGDDHSLGGVRSTREIVWRLALVGRTMADLWRRRGLPDLPFLVPVSVDLRPKGEPGATFGNVLAFHFARFRPSETADVDRLARALRGQMTDALRDGQLDANAVAMEFLKYRPLSLMLRDLPGTAARETFSFNCADLADFPPALEKLFGRRVVNAYHAPSVLPRPGIGVFFNRCGIKNNLVVSWVEGATTLEEGRRIIEAVREGMGWRTAR
ncbi:MAG: hypothetical protein DMD87_27510 [Candidatus Rokuibacteriota bacterium]|nr:MAG: hypothetical protein DMD87_27510 [Candidatus Rokubacteria bacterium]